jgi:hypothetical protein
MMMLYTLQFENVLQERDVWRVWSSSEDELNVRCVSQCLNNKVVPEIHVVALLQLKAPARTISVESTLALNPWCFGARGVYVCMPGTRPPKRKDIHDSLSVLPKLEKSQETRINTLHMVNYFPIFKDCTPLMQVPCVPKGTQEHKALA